MHKTPRDIIAKKAAGKKISVITAYDYSLATLCDKAGVDVLLVGDSAGMVVLGYENTIPVTMTNMVIFTEAVSRAREKALVVGDLPFMSYQVNHSDAIRNSGKLIKAGADAVKLEGGRTCSAGAPPRSRAPGRRTDATRRVPVPGRSASARRAPWPR